MRETLARVRRLGADAAVTVRADSGFFSYEMLDAIEDHQARYSITVAQDAQVNAAIAAIDEDAWQSIAYTRGGQAQVAEGTITTSARSRSRKPRTLRLIVRRTRLVGAQAELWPNWRHHAFITDRDDLDTKEADAYHRGHARVELAIKDLKDNGLRRCPSGRFFANGAWLACAALAHNLLRWTARLGHLHHSAHLTVAATVRKRLLTVPARLLNHSGRHRLRLPLNWPWATAFTTALGHIRNLPLLI